MPSFLRANSALQWLAGHSIVRHTESICGFINLLRVSGSSGLSPYRVLCGGGRQYGIAKLRAPASLRLQYCSCTCCFCNSDGHQTRPQPLPKQLCLLGVPYKQRAKGSKQTQCLGGVGGNTTFSTGITVFEATGFKAQCTS
jgi:hypothetical protein